MIVGAAVCPAAPFLADGTAQSPAGSLRDQVPELVVACGRAIRALASTDAILLLSTRSSGPRTATGPAGSPNSTRTLAPGTVLGSSGFGRSDCLPRRTITLPPGEDRNQSRAPVRDPAAGTVVGAVALADAGLTVPVTAVEIAGSGSDGAPALRVLADDHRRIGVLVMADGAACHGDAAPGRRNDAAEPFDQALADALTAGDPAGLAAACSDRGSARDLLATVEPLAALATLVVDLPPDRSRLLYSGAPFGVGYLVGVWQWW